jgi:hypothetical protein
MHSPKIATLVLWLTVAFTLSHSVAFAQGSLPLANGGNHSGSIALAGEVDSWTFTASTGDAIGLSIGEVLMGGADPGFNPWMRLKAPNGTVISPGGSVAGELVADIDLRAPATGTYTVEVRHAAPPTPPATGVGHYLLTLALTPGTFVVPADDEGGPMTNGANHAGKIHRGDLDQWSFSAAKDDAITLKIGEVLGAVDPGFDPWIRLRGPDGATLESVTGPLVAEIDVKAPLTGTYTVVVASYTVATGIGEYLLTLAHSPGTFVVPADDEGGPMTNGANHAGKIHRGDLDQWTFTATKDDAISLSIGQTGAAVAGFNPWIRLHGPDGAALGLILGPVASAQINVTAPLTGTYTVVAASSTVATGTGEYLLTLAQTPGTFVVPAGDEGGPMTNGANHAGKIHPRDLDQWTFTASKDDAISVSIGEVLVGGADPGFSPWIRLRGPDGATLGSSQGALVAEINGTAPLTGTYTVVVGSFTVPTAIGEYLLTLAQTPGAFVVPAGDEGGPMTNGVNHPGVIHRGDLDQWTFTATQGSAIAVGIAEVVTGGVDPGFNPWIRLRGPTGAELGSFQDVLTAQISVTAPLTGTYTVVVASYTVVSPSGSYVLQVSGAAAAAAPTTVSDVYFTHLGTPLVIAAPGVLANDNTNGGGPITAELATASTDGTVTLNADGGFTYTPPTFFVGTTTFTYRAVNSVGAGNIATVTITVNATSPPTAIDDAFTAPIDIPSAIRAPGVLANDSSNGGGPMSAVLITGVSHGALTLNSDGSFTYSPNPGFSGADGFTYRAVNASGPGNIATVSLTVSGPATAQPPTGLIASSIVGNVITFRWDAPLGGLLPTDYVLEGGLNPGQVLASLRTNSAFPIYTLTAPSGAFYVRVHTISGANRSDASNEIRVFINVPSPPSAPANLLGLVNASSLSVAWRNTFAGGAPTSMMLDVTGAIVGSVPIGPTETATFSAVPAGTYTVRLRATNAAGASAASNPITLTFPSSCSGAPLPPANFLAYKIGNTAYVIWDPPLTGPAPTSYVLNVGGPITAIIPTTARSLSGVVPPGTYNLSVAATNVCGSSPATPVQVLAVP